MNAFSAFADLVKKCAFLHDDWNPLLGINDWDSYDTNPFLLMPDVCVIGTLNGFGREYLDYLHNISLLPPQIIIPQERSDYPEPLTYRLAKDRRALQLLQKEAISNKLHISTFYSHDSSALRSIQYNISTPSWTPNLQPSIDSFTKINNRITCWQLLKSAGLPLPEGTVCYNYNDLKSFVLLSNSANQSGVLLKQGHRNSVKITPANLDDLAMRNIAFPALAEVVYDVVLSPISQGIRWGEDAQYLFTLAQKIENFKFSGNISLPPKWERFELQCRELLLEVFNLFPDHMGVFGVDFIITNDKKIFIVDVNPRFNSSTYPFYFLENNNYNDRSRIGNFGVVESERYTDLSQIYRRLGPLRYDAITHRGILLFNPVLNVEGAQLKKWSYLIVSNGPADEDYLGRQFCQKVPEVRWVRWKTNNEGSYD